MNIYTPYFYIIQDTRNGMYYAGARWAKGCHPSELLKEDGYLTSSMTVNNLIKELGTSIFIVRKIKTFRTNKEVRSYETRFLCKVKATKNSNFYNKSDNQNRPPAYGTEEFQNLILDKYGVDHYSKTQEFKEKTSATCLSKYGAENYRKSKKCQEDQIASCREKYGLDYYTQTEEMKEKSKATNLKKYGTENVYASEEIKTKIKQKNLERYGVDHPSKSKELMEKKSQNNLRKYGVLNISQLPHVKETIKQKRETRKSRPIVGKIKQYVEKYKLKISKSWTVSGDDYLESVLSDLIEKHGIL